MDKPMHHIIFYKSRSGVCPCCGGLLRTLKSDEIILHCIDCDTFFKAVDFGKAEAELEFEEVTIGCSNC